jgi:hypothetical protein
MHPQLINMNLQKCMVVKVYNKNIIELFIKLKKSNIRTLNLVINKVKVF